MIFYDAIAPLSSEKHGDLKFNPAPNYAFAKDARSVPLTAAEFPEAHKHYAIVFVNGPNEEKIPVVLLSDGSANGVNQFVDANGAWTSPYVPAFVRRYPFVPAAGDNNTMIVCIDERSDKFGTESGQPLFVPGEDQSPLVANAVKFLMGYQRDAAATQALSKRLVELDLLEASSVTLTPPGGEERRFDGFFVVSEERLRALTPDVVHELVQNGVLGVVYAHMLSLSNVARLAT